MHYTLSSFALYALKISCWLSFPNYNWFWYFWTIGFYKKCYYKTLSWLFTTFKFSFTSLMFLNSWAAVNSSRRSSHDWTVILDILFVPPVILISSSPCVYLNFSNQPFDAVNVAKSSLFNRFLIQNWPSIWKYICTLFFLVMRISLVNCYCTCLNFLLFPSKN